jgi:hypothetical protein
MCRALRAHEHEDRFGMREPNPRVIASRQGERHRLVPSTSADRVASRHISQHIGDVEVSDLDVSDGGESVKVPRQRRCKAPVSDVADQAGLFEMWSQENGINGHDLTRGWQ